MEAECLFCYNPMTLPYTLDCGHTFCYLCLKQMMLSGCTQRCPVCRRDIDEEMVEKAVSNTTIPTEGLVWLYETRDGRGWWFYDKETSDTMEKAWNDGNNVEIRILGMSCEIDFEEMVQTSSNNTRNIIRVDDVDKGKIKGIAGVRFNA